MSPISNVPLPTTWVIVQIGEIAQINPGLDKSEIDDQLEVTFVPMPAVEAETGRVDVSVCRKFGEVKKGYTAFSEGDVLFAKITPCMENGKMAVVPGLRNELGFGSTEFHVLRPRGEISAQYIYYFVSAQEFRRDAEHNMTGAVGQRRVPMPYLAQHPIPVPPASEQRRIVAKIEELFSELDKGVETLTTAREQLKAYRKSALKAAFEGKLTERWRKTAGDLATASDLKYRIATEIDTCSSIALKEWRAAVGLWEANGGTGKRPVKPRRHNSPPPPTENELVGYPSLPGGWEWVRLGELVWSVKDGPHYSPSYTESGIPFISGGNVRPRGVDFGSVKYIAPELHAELSERCKPEKGDLLYTKGGTTGIARVNTYDHEFNVWVHVAVLKLAKSIHPFYLQHALNSPLCYAQSQRFTHGVGNQDLGLTRMVNIILPLCGEAEQIQIVDRIDSLESELTYVEETIDDGLSKIESLRQSILRDAFSGQLVPQDSADEPASVLLEGIRTEKEEASHGRRKNNKNGKKEAA